MTTATAAPDGSADRAAVGPETDTDAPSTPEALVDHLRGRLARGETLPAERALAAELSVKRHQLRQALEVLRDTGELPPARVGRPAKSPDPRGADMVQWTNPMEVIELRLIIEPNLARLAALRASPAEIATITRAATTRPDADYGEADLAFHRAVAAAARNRLAAEFYAMLRRVARDTRLSLRPSEAQCQTTRLRQRDAEHRAIAEAIAARDPDGADAAMRQHLAAVQREITDRLSLGGST
jgi:DNA-binding FadR family transcriptional regulator